MTLTNNNLAASSTQPCAPAAFATQSDLASVNSAIATSQLATTTAVSAMGARVDAVSAGLLSATALAVSVQQNTTSSILSLSARIDGLQQMTGLSSSAVSMVTALQQLVATQTSQLSGGQASLSTTVSQLQTQASTTLSQLQAQLSTSAQLSATVTLLQSVSITQGTQLQTQSAQLVAAGSNQTAQAATIAQLSAQLQSTSSSLTSQLQSTVGQLSAALQANNASVSTQLQAQAAQFSNSLATLQPSSNLTAQLQSYSAQIASLNASFVSFRAGSRTPVFSTQGSIGVSTVCQHFIKVNSTQIIYDSMRSSYSLSPVMSPSPLSNAVYSITSGGLPAGLTMNAGGVISGAAAVVSVSTTSVFTVTVTGIDAIAGVVSASAVFNITVRPPVVLTFPYSGSTVTFIPPAGLTRVFARLWGSGGGQGQCTANVAYAGGGGYAEGLVTLNGNLFLQAGFYFCCLHTIYNRVIIV